MKLLAIVALFLMSCPSVFSQDDGLQRSGIYNNSGTELKLELAQELKTRSSDFFNKLISNKVDEAYKELLNGSPLVDESEDVLSLKAQTKRSFDIYGKLLSFDLYNYEYVTSSYVRLRYLAFHSKYPIRWLFTYYKSPEKGWVITNIKFDDMTEFYFSD